MSNGDDVLDNWEEIDEVGLTHTLQKIQAESQQKQQNSLIAALKKSNNNNSTSTSTISPLDSTSVDEVIKPMKLLQRTPPSPLTPQDGVGGGGGGGPKSSSSSAALMKTSSSSASPLDDMTASFQPVMMVLHKDMDDYQSVTYTQPISSQTVKILRRPTQSSESRNNGMKQNKPIKTLQQREQEYAEARLRILGSAKNPEDENGVTKTTSTNAATTTITATTATGTPAVNTVSNPMGTSLTGSSTTTSSRPVTSNAKTNSPRGGGIGGYNNHNIYATASQYHLNNHHAQLPLHPQVLAYKHQQQQQQQHQQQPPALPQMLPPNFFYAPMAHSAAYNRALGGMASLTHMAAPQHLPAHHLAHQHHQHHHNHHQHHHTQNWSPVVGGSVSSPALHRPQDSILRMPRGPDGSTGFQMRR